MKQQISLTPSTDTIHVDEVRVEDGVYAKDKQYKPHFVQIYNCRFVLVSPLNSTESVKFETLSAMIHRFEGDYDYHFFTLSGLRIVTEKPLGVEDLKNTDFVGFVRKCNKYFIAPVGSGLFSAINSGNTTTWNGMKNVFSDCIADDSDELYRFTTPQELHKWLGEDEG